MAWRKTPIKEVAFFQEGPGLRNWQWTNKGIKVINGRNILSDGQIDLTNTDKFISWDEFQAKYKHFEVHPKDIVVTSSGTLGKVARIRAEHLPLMMNTSVIRFRSLDNTILDDDFLFCYLRGEDFQEQVLSYAIGAAQSNFGPSHIKLMTMLLPPLTIQRRIAGILSAYDALIENNQRRITILEAMARALYREWFVHFRFPGHEILSRAASPLGEIPKGWQVKKLGEISSYINRGITPRYDEDGDSLVVNQKCVRDQRLSLEPARWQSKAIPSEKQIRFGDVLINSTGVGTLGRVAQVYGTLENCTVDTHVTIARPGRDTDLDFYGCCLLGLQETFERLGIGATGQTELGRSAIADIELVVPPTDLQRQFGKGAGGMRSAAVTYGKQIQSLRRARDLLLPRLLSGQIEVAAA